MNRLMNSTMIAALVFGTAAVYGQDLLVAKIPFEFRSGTTMLPAGTYSVAPLTGTGSSHILRITNGKNGIMVSGIRSSYGSPTNAPRLVFACGSQACRLGNKVELLTPKPRSEERLAVVRLSTSSAAGE